MRRKKNQCNNPVHTGGGDVTRGTVAPARRPQASPFPSMQAPSATMTMPNCGNFQVQGNGMPMGLPVYTSIDEYGRSYNPVVHYGPQTHSSPVPVAIAPAICQLNPIVSPIAFVPYNAQNQGLYQTDDDKR